MQEQYNLFPSPDASPEAAAFQSGEKGQKPQSGEPHEYEFVDPEESARDSLGSFDRISPEETRKLKALLKKSKEN